jgi:hypothetical protein
MKRVQSTRKQLLDHNWTIDWYTISSAFATVCSSRGGHFFRPDSSPPFLPAVYLREIQNQLGGFAALDVCQSVRDN